MAQSTHPEQRLWLVVVTAPLLLVGAVLVLPLVPLVLGPLVTDFGGGRVAVDALTLAVFVGYSLLATRVGDTIALELRATFDMNVYLRWLGGVSQRTKTVTTAVFAVYVLGVLGFVVSGASGALSGSLLAFVLAPLAPSALVDTLTNSIPPLVEGTTFVALAVTTGIWQVLIGTSIASVVDLLLSLAGRVLG